MFDAAPQPYENLVGDDPDDPTTPAIALGRVSTEDLTMQVFLLGEWHRKIVDLNESSCEVPFHPSERTRREQLTHRDGPLCRAGCFTPRELRRANENDRRVKEEERHRAQREHIDSLFKALNEGEF